MDTLQSLKKPAFSDGEVVLTPHYKAAQFDMKLAQWRKPSLGNGYLKQLQVVLLTSQLPKAVDNHAQPRTTEKLRMAGTLIHF